MWRRWWHCHHDPTLVCGTPHPYRHNFGSVVHDYNHLQVGEWVVLNHPCKWGDHVCESQAPGVEEVYLVKGRYESLLTYQKALINLDVRSLHLLYIVYITYAELWWHFDVLHSLGIASRKHVGIRRLACLRHVSRSATSSLENGTPSKALQCHNISCGSSSISLTSSSCCFFNCYYFPVLSTNIWCTIYAFHCQRMLQQLRLAALGLLRRAGIGGSIMGSQ